MIEINNLSTIKKCGGLKTIKMITEGSSDIKYYLRTNDNNQFLLKIYPNNYGHNVQFAFSKNKKLVSLNLRIPAIIEIGVFENSFSYELSEWIQGIPMNKLLAEATKDQQYKKGLEAGSLLKTIHLAKSEGIHNNTNGTLNERIKTAIAILDNNKKNNQQVYKGEVFKEYLCSVSMISESQNNSILHGDYHTGNLIEDYQENLWSIDWLYGHYGDPTEDFVRIFVSANCYPEFAKGQLHGYFNGDPPKDFWVLLKTYTAIQQLELLSYSFRRLPNGQTIQEHQHNIVFTQYCGMKLLIPQFYK